MHSVRIFILILSIYPGNFQLTQGVTGMNAKKFMKIGELVKATGVPKTTIRFYVDGGLLPPPVKTGRTMAYYDDRHIHLLSAIRKFQKSENLSLAQLKQRVSALKRCESDGFEENEDIFTETQKKKKEDILSAAIRVFSEKGYYRTTVNDVTDEANISTGTFYFYFKDKRELYNDVVDSLIQYISKEREKLLQGETDILTRLTRRGRAIYDHFEKYKEIIFLVRAEMGGEDQWAKTKVSGLYRSLSESAAADIQKAIDQGLIRPVDTKLVAYSFIGLIEIMALFMNLEPGYDIDGILNFLTDFTLKGLEPR